MIVEVPKINQVQVEELYEKIAKAERILLTSHIRPDGDAVGSVGGLYHILSDIGKRVTVVLADPPPAAFIHAVDGISIKSFDQLEKPYDLAIVLDSGSIDRIGCPHNPFELGEIITIDHHITNEGAGLSIIEATVSSTCELVFRLFMDGYPLSKKAADALYMGIITDTRSFQNNNVSPTTLACAAALLNLGADRPNLQKNMNNSKTIIELKILAQGLSKAHYDLEKGLAWVGFDLDYLKSLNATPNQIWIANIFSSLLIPREIGISITAVEMQENKTQVEFRSKEKDVSKIAQFFGGGGHVQASGCCLDMKPQQALEKILTEGPF